MGKDGETVPGPAAGSPGEREALASARDRKADQREALVDERERRLEEHVRAVKAVVERLAKESQDLIDRSHALLAASGHDVKGHTAAEQPAPPSGQHHSQEQAQAGTGAGSEPSLADEPAGPASTIQRAVALRRQLSVTVAALAATEEEVARIHEEIAAGRRDGSETYRHTAEEAHTRARQLRELEQHLRE